MAKQPGCVLNHDHESTCYVGTKAYDCDDAQKDAEIARLRAELAEARRDLTEAIIRESEANRELGREQMRSEAARRELDERPAISREDADAYVFVRGSQARRDRCWLALRAHAAGSDAKGGENG